MTNRYHCRPKYQKEIVTLGCMVNYARELEETSSLDRLKELIV